MSYLDYQAIPISPLIHPKSTPFTQEFVTTCSHCYYLCLRCVGSRNIVPMDWIQDLMDSCGNRLLVRMNI